MAVCQGPTVPVHGCGVQVEMLTGRQHLGGISFHDVEDLDICNRESACGKECRDGGSGPEAWELWVGTDQSVVENFYAFVWGVAFRSELHRRSRVRNASSRKTSD